MIKFHGYPYTVFAFAYFKVIMEHKLDKEEAENEAYLATDRIFDGDEFVRVHSTEVTSIEKQKHIDVAEVKMDLRIDVAAFDYDDAYEKARTEVEDATLPFGVSFDDFDPCDSEYYKEELLEYMAE